LIEKEHTIGGNSAKASSGINACCPRGELDGDNLLSFTSDTMKSAGKSAQLSLIETLTGNSAKAVEWLQNRVHVDLSVLAQLGGHSHKRTHRPSEGMVGAELIFGLQREIKKYEKSGKVRILLDTQVSKLSYDGERVVGVDIRSSVGANNNTNGTILAANVILATGGFASDRSPGSYLDQYRPELMKMPATAGDFSTGDGIRLAMELGAGTVDMDKIQLHPTGWVDDSDPQNPTKILAAELIRGVGGLLLNKHGKRYVRQILLF
jgi:succinate dehydrogenase/fumarate reductase flavoprotein subunit